MGKGLDKQANVNWEEYRLNLLQETTVDNAETEADKLKRITVSIPGKSLKPPPG